VGLLTSANPAAAKMLRLPTYKLAEIDGDCCQRIRDAAAPEPVRVTKPCAS
jgi:hypothetical protein